MTILALDLGSKLGWALRRPSGVFSGVEQFKPGRFEGGGMQFLRFDRWLSDICYAHDVRQIVFEEVIGFGRHAGATKSAMVYGGFLATLTKYGDATLIPYRGIPVGTIKKAMLGKGGGKGTGKPEMVAAVKAAGFDPKDDNQADAIAILLCAEQQGRERAA